MLGYYKDAIGLMPNNIGNFSDAPYSPYFIIGNSLFDIGYSGALTRRRGERGG
jgi:hypothetical protein